MVEETEPSGRRRIVVLLPLLGLAGLAAAFIFGLGRDPNIVQSNLIGQAAPGFDLPRLQGEGRFTLDDLRAPGEPVVLNFFASWCGPCRVEHPVLSDLAQDAPVYGIAWRDDPENARRFLAQLGDPFRDIGVDRENRIGVDFGLYGVPETYVIGRDGQILLRHAGPITPALVEDQFVPLLK